MSEMEMVDRVAEAIENCFAHRVRPLITAEDMALAAIKAMREPTEAMCSKGGGVEIDASFCDVQVAGAADRVWHAMIDEALK